MRSSALEPLVDQPPDRFGAGRLGRRLALYPGGDGGLLVEREAHRHGWVAAGGGTASASFFLLGY